MKRSFSLVVALLLVSLLGCQQAAEPTQAPIVSNETALARRPTATPVASATTAASPATATADVAETAGPAAEQSPTPASATSTPSTAVAGLSYCGKTFGSGSDERFSAQLLSISAESAGDTERLTLSFELGEGSLHGAVSCLLPAAGSLVEAEQQAALLRLTLPGWEHDRRFAASADVLDAGIPLSGTQVMHSAVLRADPDASAGLVLELGLGRPVPFDAQVEGDQIVIEVARAPQQPYGIDPLGQVHQVPSLPDAPLFFVQGGDLWRFSGGEVAALADTPELETDLATSPDGSRLAFCRADAAAAAGLGTLWISQSDGSEARRIADVGGCADPAFSPQGERVFFVAPLAPTPPLVFQLWSVDLSSGAVEQLSFLDEWSRRSPQPLADGSVVSVASAGPQRSGLLLDQPDGVTRELSAELLGLGAYTGVSSALVAPDGRSIAVAARRVGGGADLALLGVNGKLLSAVQDGYWNRPLAWGHDGTLYYLRATCRSGLILTYEIHALSGGEDHLLISGAMDDDIGAAAATESGLALVRQPSSHLALRGPLPPPADSAALWLLGPDGGRGQIYATQEPIEALVP